MAETIWKGEADSPRDLADDIDALPSEVLRLPGVEPMEIVSIQMSAENRALIVRALRAFSEAKH